MDKSAIKTFAIESRRQLIESVKYQASLIGITAEGINDPVSKAEGMETYDYGAGTYTIFDNDIQRRESLIKEINNKGFDNVVEEVAYTWFNRIIAIRFMEVNDYLPTRIRVLSSEIEGKLEPDIITEALELDLDYTIDDEELILKLKEENELDELFRFLFIKQCNKLNEVLSGLFEKTDDYMEILLTISFTDESGFVRKLLNSISEDEFRSQVEIIGWLYQFYNSELKDETFANLKKRIKISKDRIPAATQLFTPDWIVKYMVENSLGRLWLDRHPNEDLKSKWKYYVDESDQEVEVKQKLITICNEYEISKPEDISVIDPCMGSGHILVYAFDVLMDIYISEGYTEKEACENILRYNLYGLDIDDRAFQLSYFAVLMKARKYNRKILENNISPLICSINESNNISERFMEHIFSKTNDEEIKEDLSYILDVFKDAKEYGSILEIKNINFIRLKNFLNELDNDITNLFLLNYQNEFKLLKKLIFQSMFLSKKYDVVITNPPYMNITGMNQNLRKYLTVKYPNTKSDLFAVFIERCKSMNKDNGFLSMITQQSFMFLATFENLRENILDNILINMVHLGARAFEEIGGEVVQTVSFVCQKSKLNNYKTTFYRLVDYHSPKLKENAFLDNENAFVVSLDLIKNIPDKPFAYWAQKDLIEIFNNPVNVNSVSTSPGQNITGNNKKFLRYLWEVDTKKINKNNKWVFYVKGGGYQRWAGNLSHVVDWSPEALNHYKKDKICRLVPEEYRFKKGITFGIINTDRPSFRVLPEYCTYDKAGTSIFINDEKNFEYILGLLNSNLFYNIINLVNPTLSTRVYDIKNMPLILDDVETIASIVNNCCSLSENDWNDYETSPKFITHPFIKFAKDNNKIKNIYQDWETFKENQFRLLKKNEIDLNEKFAKIYDVDINCDVEDKHVSITKANYENDIKSFISYAVGCMFGRYSLSENGLVCTNNQFDLKIYNKFIPDDDNIIPILDTEYFNDDIVGRFVEFVKVCFGEETLEENLDFIAGALKKKGKTSRKIIRNYFLNDFFKDHSKTYNKCPIYWQFDSGKQNAFKCLIYMHRYDSTLPARVRTDYLHKTQRAIEDNLNHCENIISNSTNKSEISRATKDKTKYIKQLDEIKVYDEALGHIANQHIEIDLDDGVKVNHAKFQKIEISREGEKTKKINLLKNI